MAFPQNWYQKWLVDPTTTNQAGDLLYFARSPYGSANDVVIDWNSFIAQFAAPYTPAALTKTNDANVTLTLGGTPATSLLQATSLTLGWSGQLSLTRGGTNANLTASNGGIFYSTASAGAILAGTATANQILLSGSSTTPAWSTATYPATTTINQILYSSSANVIGGLSTLNNGVLITGATGIPAMLANGTAGYVLTANSGAPPSWQAAPAPTPAALTESNDTNVTMTLGGTPSTALLQAVSMTLGWTGQLSVARGGTGSASVVSAPAATAWAGWDANKNLSANSLIEGYATTATAAGTTTLVVGSAQQQYFTGSTTQTVTLPVTSTLVLGQQFFIVNNSSGVVTVQSSGANSIQAMAASTTLLVTCILTSGTTAASWNAIYAPISSAGSGPWTASGTSSAQGGSSATATGTSSLSYGSSSNANAGSNCISVGSGNTITTGSLGLAMFGYSNSTNGGAANYGLVAGNSNTIESNYCFALGQSCTNTSSFSFTSGTNCTAAHQAFAFGNTCTSSGTGSVTFGQNATASNSGSFVFNDQSATGTNLADTGSNQFVCRFNGGYYFNTAATSPVFNLLGTASAVNYVALTNNTTGNPPVFNARGTDTNIDLNIGGKGTGAVNILGASTNSSAPSGYVGEVISSVIVSGSAVSFTTATPRNITSISLTAGDWDVWGNVYFIGSTTNMTSVFLWISSTSATVPDPSVYNALNPIANAAVGLNAPALTFQLSGTTTIYLSAEANFATGTATGCGGIYARRRR